MTLETTSNGTREVATAESTDAIRRLLSATSSHDGDVGGTIDDLGAGLTARVLLEEILFRASLQDLAAASGDGVSATLVLKHAGRDFPATVSVGPGGVVVHDGPAGITGGDATPTPVIAQDMAEVALALYGPAELVSGATRTIRWPDPEIVYPSRERGRGSLPTVFYAVAQRVIRVLDRQEPADLAELAVQYGTDKWGALHQYPQYYLRHLGALRDQRISILEIGIGGFLDPLRAGASLRMWKRFFPRALVHGIDILDKSGVEAPRLTTIQADQSDSAAIADMAERYGPFDVIIDDGSHISSHVIGTFQTLFPHLRRNGLYFIEDLCTAYWPERFEGNDTDLNNPNYTVGFLKTLLDGLHHQEFIRTDAREPQPTDTQINAVHVYHNLAVIEKGPNTEDSPVADLFRRQREAQG